MLQLGLLIFQLLHLRAFNYLIRVFELLTRRFELEIRGFELVTRKSELANVPRKDELFKAVLSF